MFASQHTITISHPTIDMMNVSTELFVFGPDYDGNYTAQIGVLGFGLSFNTQTKAVKQLLAFQDCTGIESVAPALDLELGAAHA